MYAPNYGYPNAAVPPNFNNGAPPPAQNPHMQPGTGPAQPGQQMMYNPQQFAAMAGAPQGGFVGGPNPGAVMMPGAGPAGMMQNTAMAHMAANGQMAYQTPYGGVSYGAPVPTPGGPQQFPPNYMAVAGMGGFPMNPAALGPQQQQMLQRMQQGQQPNAGVMGANTPQRSMSMSQGPPNNAMPPQQAQFQTPQPPSQSQTPTSHQPPNPTITTPQTPTFPSAGAGPTTNGSAMAATPLSPGTESRESERFNVLLDINQELLFESMQLHHTLQELKKEEAAAKSTEGPNSGLEKKIKEQENLCSQDYGQCMRRLQANLGYLASLADRKPSVQVPPCPAYLSPPPLNLSLRMKPQPGTENDGRDLGADREERDKGLKLLYSKLQSLFPGIDPRKEPAFQAPNQRQPGAGGQVRPGGGQGGKMMPHQGSPPADQGQRTPQMVNAAVPGAVPMPMG